MAKANKLSSSERSAKLTGKYSTRNQIIGGIFLLFSIGLTWLLNYKNKESGIQNVRDQKIDTGSINNYNANGNITVENNTYNGLNESLDSATANGKTIKYRDQSNSHQKKDTLVNVTSNNQSGGQTANQIINNN